MLKQPLRILCVEPASEQASVIERCLRTAFACTFVDGTPAARARMATDDAFAAVVVGGEIPPADGLQLLRECRQRQPELACVMFTSHDPAEALELAALDGGVYRLVRASWPGDAIVQSVREACELSAALHAERALRAQLAAVNARLDEKIRDLDEANELLEYWVEYSPAVLYSLSCEGDTLRPSYISKNFFRLTGYERTAAVIDGNFWASLIDTATRASYRQVLRQLTDGETVHAVLEYDLRHKSGAMLRVLDSLRAVHDADGRTVEIVGAWTDVSARS